MKLATKLLKWFDLHGRHDLPWQIEPTPYRVWVSEIMLQQTQVKTVIPYFLRFMQNFPDVNALANAEPDQVLDLWTGLGYYARARNLHKTAKIVAQQFGGQFPKTVTELEQLPGIGRSTAGAILSLANNIRAPILDGNVKRVFCRLIALKQPPSNSKAQEKLWDLAEELLPQTRVNDYNQALMDLGATLCTRTKPKCTECPLQSDCVAYAENTATHYPCKKEKIKQPLKSTIMLLLENNQGAILLHKRPPRGIWGGLWSFPQCENEDELEAICKKQFACKVKYIEKLPTIMHTFSHFKLIIQPIRAQVSLLKNRCMETAPQIWYNHSEPLPGGVATPILKLLKEIAHGSTR